METLSHVDISGKPLISSKDIVSYYGQTHELKLTPAAYGRVVELQVPGQGTSFLVCVDKAPVYWGAFWTPLSSYSFEGVTIWKPLTTGGEPVLALDLGYPSSSFYRGQDPRGNPQVIDALEKAGKLVTEIAIDSVEILPHSLKGYELYSWEAENQWHFTLITGTNRNKTWQEIVSGEDEISNTGWTKIQVIGEAAIKNALGKLPKGESVFWLDERGLAQAVEPPIKMGLPPAGIISDIKSYAEGRCIDLVVSIS
jgi:hypothetical protein